jgi:imidazolonepropionase-like amidohydrolase
MTIVVKGGTLIDGTGQEPVPDSAVIIQDGSILAAGPEAGMKWSEDAAIIDAEGKTVLPGFIDCHSHAIAYEYDLETRITTPMSLTVIKTLKNMRTMLESGVTTLRDAGGVDLGLKLAVQQGLVPGPRLFICIVPLTQTGGLFDLHLGSGATLNMSEMYGTTRCFIGGVETLRQKARELLLAGADVLKVSSTASVYRTGAGKPPPPQYTVEEMQAVVYEAKAAGKHTMTHCEGGVGLRNALEAGIDTIEHGFYLTDDDLQHMIDQGAYLVPTLNCNYGILKISERDPDSGIHPESIEVAKQIIADHRDSVRRAHQAGVKIAMGADAFGWDHGDYLHELILLVGAGLTPMEAIVAGTKTGAELLGVEDKLGTVTPGKFADLLVVDGDPLADISILRDQSNLRVIMQEGRVFKNTLEEKD